MTFKSTYVVAFLVIQGSTLLGQSPLGPAFTYQGRLKNSGSPANGTYSLTFALFDAQASGTQIGISNGPLGVSINEGLFAVTLNSAGEFGTNAFNGDRRWLEISVNGTTLAPRQELTGAPYALAVRPPLDLTASNGGIGTIKGANSAANSGSIGVEGLATAPSGTTYGVLGRSDSDTGYGLYGFTTSVTGANYGVFGESDSPSGYGGYFIGRGYFSGNVGIGTTTPTQLLDVHGGSIGVDGDVVLSGNNPAITNPVSGGRISFLSGSRVALNPTGGGGSGNVGIWTSNPQQALDVAGTVQATGFKMPTGGAPGSVLTSDADGVGTWQTLQGSSVGCTVINSVNTPGDASSIYKITQSGSYCLMANIVGVANKHGLLISAGNVTVDLNGFAVIGAASSLDGIRCLLGGHANLKIRNGTISGWGGDGVNNSLSFNNSCENLTVSANGGRGIRGSARTIISKCASIGNIDVGISTGTDSSIIECICHTNSSSGIEMGGRCQVAHNDCDGNAGSAIKTIATDSLIESNYLVNNARGIEVTGTRNLILRNIVGTSSIADYVIGIGNSFGQIIHGPGDEITSSGAYINFSTSSCAADQTSCGGACKNLQTDPNNCGQCNNVCGPGMVCVNGSCQVACQTGLNNCSGICVDKQTDENNCGSCGTVCPSGYSCVNGTCQLSCQIGLTNCSGVCVNKQTDENNCGSCGTVCPNGYRCVNGVCQLSCQTGLTNCGNTCRDTATDRNNCGSCGHVCPSGQNCVNGVCQ